MMPLLFIALLGVSGIGAVIDARTGRIPNWLTLPAALLGVTGHLLHAGAGGAVKSLLGLGAGAFVPWVLYRTTRGRGIGGGDVKLFAALGALGGPALGLEIQLSAFVLLVVFALVRLAFRGRLLVVLLTALRMLVQRLLPSPLLPKGWRGTSEAQPLTEMRMGPAIAAGVVAVLLRDSMKGLLPWVS
jgi:prepilin peptidase CpaA